MNYTSTNAFNFNNYFNTILTSIEELIRSFFKREIAPVQLPQLPNFGTFESSFFAFLLEVNELTQSI